MVALYLVDLADVLPTLEESIAAWSVRHEARLEAKRKERAEKKEAFENDPGKVPRSIGCVQAMYVS